MAVGSLEELVLVEWRLSLTSAILMGVTLCVFSFSVLKDGSVSLSLVNVSFALTGVVGFGVVLLASPLGLSVVVSTTLLLLGSGASGFLMSARLLRRLRFS